MGKVPLHFKTNWSITNSSLVLQIRDRWSPIVPLTRRINYSGFWSNTCSPDQMLGERQSQTLHAGQTNDVGVRHYFGAQFNSCNTMSRPQRHFCHQHQFADFWFCADLRSEFPNAATSGLTDLEKHHVYSLCVKLSNWNKDTTFNASIAFNLWSGLVSCLKPLKFLTSSRVFTREVNSARTVTADLFAEQRKNRRTMFFCFILKRRSSASWPFQSQAELHFWVFIGTWNYHTVDPSCNVEAADGVQER